MKKYAMVFVIVIFILGFMIGIKQDEIFVNVIDIGFSNNYFIYWVILLLSLFLLTFIGAPAYYLFLVIDILLGGVSTALLWKGFKIKGLIFSFLFIVFIKSILWFLLFLNGFYSLKLIKNEFIYLFKRYKSSKKNFKLYLKKTMIIDGFILTINIILSLVGNKLYPFTKLFTFLLS